METQAHSIVRARNAEKKHRESKRAGVEMLRDAIQDIRSGPGAPELSLNQSQVDSGVLSTTRSSLSQPQVFKAATELITEYKKLKRQFSDLEYQFVTLRTERNHLQMGVVELQVIVSQLQAKISQLQLEVVQPYSMNPQFHMEYFQGHIATTSQM